ncbi:hypothetical protein BC834DRAFT_970548 [Gloeopeniophorella convolvens]|nr:hypothetical protein BC834DRAFT_970548 [Gloeopeniophorella convolvens]
MIAVRNTISGMGAGLFIDYILCLIPIVILYYDYLISLSDEVEYFWLWGRNGLDHDVSTQPLVPGSHRKQTRRLPRLRLDWISCLCLVNRYVAIVGHIPVMKSYLVMGDLADTSDAQQTHTISCQQLWVYHQFFEIILQMLVGVLCIVRTYSLYNEGHHTTKADIRKTHCPDTPMPDRLHQLLW